MSASDLRVELRAYLRALPKAELHLHIEGSLEPEMVFALAQKHGMKLPYATVDALRAAYDFADLQSFLDIYYAGAGVLRDEDDFHAMTAAYLRRAHAAHVCPLSNVRLKVYPDLRQHNIKQLLEAGLCVTVNSDDPAYFGGYVLDNHLAIAEALDLSKAQLAQLARHSFEASFLDDASKRKWLSKIDALAALIPH